MTNEQKKEYERNWYKTIGKEKRKSANKNWRERKKQEYKEWKATLKCERCGENHPACLDFHHLDPNEKEMSIATMAGLFSLDRIKEEASKCIVLCSNCHRKEHYKAD